MIKWVDKIINHNKKKREYKKYYDYLNHGPVESYMDLFGKKPKNGCFYTDDYVIWLENTLLVFVRRSQAIEKIVNADVDDEKII